MMTSSQQPDMHGERPSFGESKTRLVAYLHVVQFEDTRAAGQAYLQVQQAVFASDAELSVYRLLWRDRTYVAILGDLPAPDLAADIANSLSGGAATPLAELETQLRALLAAGTPSELPQEVLDVLIARRQQAIQQGSWVESHYRPGLHPHRTSGEQTE